MEEQLLKRALPWANNLVPYQPGKPIEELKREKGLSKIIKLASNENPLGPSPKALAAINDSLINNLHYYPDGSGYELKESLAKYHNKSASNFVLGNGSDQIFGFIIKSLVSPDDNIVMSEYGFAAYAIAAKSVGAKVKFAKSVDWGHSLDNIISEIDDKTKVVFVANPNNPTGTWNKKQEFEAFIERVPKNVLIVVDQAYYEYIKDNPNYPNAVDYLDNYNNLIVTFTFSKAFGLAGLRVGYGIANTEVSSLLDRFRLPFNINQIGLSACVAALEDKDHIKRTVNENVKGKEFFYSKFSELGLEYVKSEGNFVMVDVARDSISVYESLQDEGIIVRPLHPYGITSWLRISIGLQEENELLIEKLKVVL